MGSPVALLIGMSIPARVCIVAPEFVGPFPNGGVGTACYWEARVLGEAGFEVTVLYTGATVKETEAFWTDHFARSAPFAYVDLHAWAATHCAGHPNGSSDPLSPEAYVADMVYAWLKDRPFDLVLAQEFLGHSARALQARHAGYALRGQRAAVTMHSCRQWVFEGMRQLPSSPQDVVVDFLERESARLADLVIAPSGHMAEWARQHWQIDAATVVPYCFDPHAARPRERTEHRGPFRHLVFFGRLETRKGLHLFCRALASGRLRGVEKATFLGKHSSVEGMPSAQFIERALAAVPNLQVEMVSHLGSLEAQAWLKAQEGVLVVAPSLADNLPYALIELYSHRIPFVSNRIGGIPEIVGARNSHMLAEPTVDGLTSTLERVLDAGSLVVDYTDGYDVLAANRAHVTVVAGLMNQPAAPSADTLSAFAVAVAGVFDAEALAAVRERLAAADPLALTGTWYTLEDWAASTDASPVVVLDAHVEPAAGFWTSFVHGAAQPSAGLVTSYYGRGEAVVQPLGRALESGWTSNVFGGPCLAASPQVLPILRQAAQGGPVSFWQLYAAAATRGAAVTVVPEPLFSVPDTDVATAGFDAVQGVTREYVSQRPADLDLEWLLKTARLGGAGGHADETGRADYDRLIGATDEHIRQLAGLDIGRLDDPYRQSFADIRARLAPMLADWRVTRPRVFIYGAGLHSRMLLGLMPELGPYVGGFIDRRPMSSFLGKPCIRPEAFDNHLADVILYSSREHEEEMYQTLKQAAVDHVRLYGPAVPLVPREKMSRVSRRFGMRREERHALYRMFTPPDWAKGHIAHDDAMFLYEMIKAVSPKTILELGVASGTSSAAILYTLDQLTDPQGRRLISADVRPTCYFDPSRATGEAVSTMYPAAMAQWQLWTSHTAHRLLAELEPASIDLLFIDANHSHPWPTLDLLHLAPVMKPGAWVVLHDVELPHLHPQYQAWGPNFLYEAWPFNKVHEQGGRANIGAVQLPAHLPDVIPVALSLLERAWEHVPFTWDVKLPADFRGIEQAIAARLRKAHADAAA